MMRVDGGSAEPVGANDLCFRRTESSCFLSSRGRASAK